MRCGIMMRASRAEDLIDVGKVSRKAKAGFQASGECQWLIKRLDARQLLMGSGLWDFVLVPPPRPVCNVAAAEWSDFYFNSRTNRLAKSISPSGRRTNGPSSSKVNSAWVLKSFPLTIGLNA